VLKIEKEIPAPKGFHWINTNIHRRA